MKKYILRNFEKFAGKHLLEAATRGAQYKKLSLKISQDSQDNTCVGISFLIKLQA